MLVHGMGQSTNQGLGEERMMQLLRCLNKLLDRAPESRRRLLNWHTPIIVPVWPQVCARIRSRAAACLPPLVPDYLPMSPAPPTHGLGVGDLHAACTQQPRRWRCRCG